MRRILATALGLALAAPVAQAAVVSGSFSGTFNSGTDGISTAGAFGYAQGQALGGISYTGTFSYDTSLMSVVTDLDGMTATSIYTQGTATSNGAITATLTVNNVSRSFVGQVGSFVYADANLPEFDLSLTGIDAATSLTLNVSDSAVSFLPGDGLVQTVGPFAPNSTSGVFSISTDVTSGGSLGLSLSNFEMGPATTTPEPASMALLASGFAGLVLRRRSRRYRVL